MKINLSKLNFYSSFILGISISLGLSILLFKILPSFNLLTTKTCRHVDSTCQQFMPLSNPLISFPYLSLWLLGLLILSISFITVFYQILATLRFKKELLTKKIDPPKELMGLIKKLGLENKVIFINDPRLFSFCLGFFSPKIFLSTPILTKLDLSEIEAILLHEKYHLEHHDPLKILISQNIKRAFFFLPVFKDLNDGYIVGKELAADKKAIMALKNKKILINALLKIFSSQSPFSFQGAVTGQLSVTRERIKALDEPKKIKKIHLSFLNVFLSLVIILSLIFIGQNVNSITFDSLSSNCSCPADHQCTMTNHECLTQEKTHSCLNN